MKKTQAQQAKDQLDQGGMLPEFPGSFTESYYDQELIFFVDSSALLWEGADGGQWFVLEATSKEE